jgi:hypothetical protein
MLIKNINLFITYYIITVLQYIYHHPHATRCWSAALQKAVTHRLEVEEVISRIGGILAP